ncbi:MAG: helix-hairpin-helix domain-containing protein [Chitinophagales bacterium]|jgi:competence ComEA-like helix-hairpin-helix protein|nr:helix-hairpin-helix domain-containing protein [Chitinophagales bacterium]
MNQNHSFFKEFFSVYAKDFSFVMGASLFMFIVLNVFQYYHTRYPVQSFTYEAIASEVNEYQNYQANPTYKHKDIQVNINTKKFNFDPNVASINDFIALGMSAKTAHIIENYREKGGKFYKKEDLAKIFTLSPDLYQALEPYIVIIKESKAQYQRNDKTSFLVSEVFINTTNASELSKLENIGFYNANKIIKFRDKLGGFVDIAQVQSVYGLEDSTYQSIKDKIKIDKSLIKKINVNKATFAELDAHPYISSYVATDIVANAPYSDFDDLLLLKSIQKNKFIQYLPYYFSY